MFLKGWEAEGNKTMTVGFSAVNETRLKEKRLDPNQKAQFWSVLLLSRDENPTCGIISLPSAEFFCCVAEPLERNKGISPSLHRFPPQRFVAPGVRCICLSSGDELQIETSCKDKKGKKICQNFLKSLTGALLSLSRASLSLRGWASARNPLNFVVVRGKKCG